MSVDPNAGGTGTPVDQYIRIAKQYWESARSAYEDITGAAPSKREAEVLREAGYKYVTKGTKLERGWVDPTGRGITADEAAKRADDLKWEQRARAVGEKTPQMKRREREMLERELGKVPEATTKQPRTRGPDAKRPPGRLGRIVEGVAAVAGGTGVIDILGRIPEILAPEPAPPPPPKLPPVDIPPGAEWMPRGPFVPSTSSPPIQPPPPQPSAPVPERPPARAPTETVPILTEVGIWQSPLPIPAPPAPATALPGGAPVATAPTPPAAPLWKQALPFLAPLALSALTVPGASGKRRRDALTVPQEPTLGSLLPSLASSPLPYPGVSYFGGGGGGGSSTEQCSCKPKGPRKPKRKRTVCYTGTYTEKASGIRKLKRRKVPCQ